MKKAYCLLNHALTERQISELRERYGVEDIDYPTEELSQSWSQVPATKTLDVSPVQAVVKWLSSAQKGDILIVQGEVGSTFMVVDFALKNGLVPLHAVTKRVAREEREGEIVRRSYVFEHVCFRVYRYFGA